MRAGGSTVQQPLTPEAASIVKQAVNLARRRGHAQVTPLHVANVMLSSSTGLLRAACLQSHSHPLQCKALELCFNVALNRLPASTTSVPMLGPHPPHGHGHGHHPPSLSNALVAAFKRAQAQQRRGSIESQQQPLLAVKIEVEQLIISILDDPSVSRVMKEAGFSSTQVKSNVEQAVSSSEICGSSTPSANGAKPKESATCHSTPAAAAAAAGKLMPPGGQVRQDDVKIVMDFLASCRKKRSVVFVGECLATTEGVVKAVMDNAGKPEEAPEVLRNVQFISLPLITFRCLSREEVEEKVGELRCLVNDCRAEGGVVLYLGDLKWAAEYRAAAAAGTLDRISCYSPVEHVIVELGRLVSGGSDEAAGGRFWLIGVATYQTYMTCRAGRPSLESIWGLHPLTIPAGSLSLSLSCDGSGVVAGAGRTNKLSCCGVCTAKFEAEARATMNGFGDVDQGSASSNLPPWLRTYKEENRRAGSRNHDQRPLGDLCRKWNVICTSSHTRNIHHRRLPEKFLNFSSVSPANSPPPSSHDQPYSYVLQPRQAWPVPATNIWRLDQQSWISQASAGGGGEPCQGSTFLDHNPNPNPISTSSSETMEVEYPHRFKELNAENLKTLCLELEKRAAWQKDIIPDIAGAVLRSRSGMTRRRSGKSAATVKEDTWLFFQGGDNEGKEKIARGLAGIVFGRQASFTPIGLSSFSSTRSDSSDDLRIIKRSRAEAGHGYIERFTEAVRGNPYSVILLEDIEQTDYCSRVGIKNAIEKGRICSSDGEDICLGEAIVILSCESFDSRSRACSPPVNQQRTKRTGGDEGMIGCRHEEISSHATDLDLNLSAGEDDDYTRDWFPNDDVDLTQIFELVDGKFFFKLRDDF